MTEYVCVNDRYDPDCRLDDPYDSVEAFQEMCRASFGMAADLRGGRRGEYVDETGNTVLVPVPEGEGPLAWVSGELVRETDPRIRWANGRRILGRPHRQLDPESPTVALTIRVSAAERERWRARATDLGVTLSDYLRTLVRDDIWRET